MIKTHKPIRILKIMTAILFILSVLVACVYLLIVSVLPSHGIYVVFNTKGDSMGETLTDDALIIAKEIPFEELEVGDIIFFKEWLNLRDSNTSIVINNTKGDISTSTSEPSGASSSSDSSSSAPSGDMKNTEDTESPEDTDNPEVTDTLKDSDTIIVTGTSSSRDIAKGFHDPDAIFYDWDIEYNERANMIHRIISINTNGDRAVFTKGDGNGGMDPKPVLKSGYRYKVVWFKNGLGMPLRILFLHKGFLYMTFATVVMVALCLVLHVVAARKQE